MPKGGGWSHGERLERWLWVRGETWSGDPEHRQWRGSLPRPPCRRRPPAGPAAGRPPAEAALAGPPRVHAQPRRGRPHLGQDCRLPAPLREAPRPGAGRRPPQHEAAGEAAGGGAGVGPGPRAEGRARPSPQLWMRLSGALQKKRSSELTYRELVKNSSNDDTMAAKQVSLGPGGAALGLGCWRLRDARGASPWPGRSFRPQRASGSSVAGAGEVSKRPPNLVHEGPLEILNTDLEASFQRVSFHGPGIWDLIFITPPTPTPTPHPPLGTWGNQRHTG